MEPLKFPEKWSTGSSPYAREKYWNWMPQEWWQDIPHGQPKICADNNLKFQVIYGKLWKVIRE